MKSGEKTPSAQWYVAQPRLFPTFPKLAQPSLCIFQLFERSNRMGMEDQAAGAVKQVKGKANDVIGAAKGDVGQQLKGKAQEVAGKVQSAVGKATSDPDKK
jgi:uncharacterized protein YjbJ (UPF0337 family)